LHSRLHQPTDPETPSPVAAGLAALLRSLSEVDKQALARLLLASGDAADSSRAGPSGSSAELRGG
jgi:hypothetical protein